MTRGTIPLAILLAAAPLCWGDPPETVPVGDAGNSADSTGFGSVEYAYRIGKYEVTNAEYCEFLNAEAKTDRHQLYDVRMAGGEGGIQRAGKPGGFRYKTKSGWNRKPVSFVTWESCARYANWLTVGDADRGPYRIDGGRVRLPDHAALAARRDLSWVIASENEWYKAAYYDPEKSGGGYWPFAARGGSAPKCNLNTAAISEVGAFKSASSAYGTFDQNGNLWEYLEGRKGGKVGLRGGSYYHNDRQIYLRSSTRYDVLSAKWPNYGFRVVALGRGKARSPRRVKKDRPTPVPEATIRRSAKTFYVSRSDGRDEWSGDSSTRPWKTLSRASIRYRSGDRILLKRGDTWNEQLHAQGNGTAKRPILIGAYGKGKRPVIDREDYKVDRTGIYLNDQGGIKIVGLEFRRCMTGIYGEYSDDAPKRKSIWIEDCYFRDSLQYRHYEDYPKRKIGLGICLFSWERDNRVVLEDITIKSCVFRRLASGVWTNSPDNFNKNASYVYNFKNLVMEDCLFEEGYQWQQGIRGVDTGLMRNCVTHDIGRGFRSFNGVAGSMFFRCKNWLFEDCEWGFVSIGLGSGDGEAFDFEGNCDDMTMRRCLFHDTDGPGFLLCCYASDGHAHTGIVMENCVINGKSKRPIGLPRCAIVNTTDWNESTWKQCRFYLSEGEALMRVMDPEKDKKTAFVDCRVKDLVGACSTPKLPARVSTDKKEGWIQLNFGKPVTVNEFRIGEKPSSSVSRYAIECWDERRSKWVSCFNGRGIGPSFVAPIVSRTTSKARLRLMATKKGEPRIAEFAAFDDPTGEPWNVARGRPTPNRVGRATAPKSAPAPVARVASESVKREVVWDLPELFRTPKRHKTEERPATGLRSFFYEGADYKGKPALFFAYYGTPEGDSPAGGWPAVVCVHGGGGTAYPSWVRKWNRRGYAAIAMDLEGHLPGGKHFGVEGSFPVGQRHANSGPSRIDWFGDRDLPDREQWYYHAVAGVIRANSLLRSSRVIHRKKIGLTGISWGGTVVSAVAGLDSRFAFVIPVYGGGFIHESDNPGLAQWFPPKHMTAGQFEDYRRKWDPAAHLPHAKMPMLWVTSVADPVFQIDIFARSAQTAGGPSTLCMRPWMIHGHGNGWNDAVEIGQFADSIVKGGPPLPKLGRPKVDPASGLVRTRISGKDITEAWIYLTTSKEIWKNRKWQFIQCTIGEKELIAKKALPPSTTAYVVYVFKDVGGQRSNHAASDLVVLSGG